MNRVVGMKSSGQLRTYLTDWLQKIQESLSQVNFIILILLTPTTLIANFLTKSTNLLDMIIVVLSSSTRLGLTEDSRPRLGLTKDSRTTEFRFRELLVQGSSLFRMKSSRAMNYHYYYKLMATFLAKSTNLLDMFEVVFRSSF